MSKHIKHTKGHKKSKIKARKRKVLRAREINCLLINVAQQRKSDNNA